MSCLEKDAGKRPSVEDLLQFPLLRDAAREQQELLLKENQQHQHQHQQQRPLSGTKGQDDQRISGRKGPLFTSGHVETLLSQTRSASLSSSTERRRRKKGARGGTNDHDHDHDHDDGDDDGDDRSQTADKVLVELEEEVEFIRLMEDMRRSIPVKVGSRL